MIDTTEPDATASPTVGAVVRTPEAFTVTGDGLARFSDALGGGRVPAPTYPIVLSLRALDAAVASIGLDLRGAVHRDQSFVHRRPVRAGDVLDATARITRVRPLPDGSLVTIEVDVTDGAGAPVCTAVSTLLLRGSAAVDPDGAGR